MPDMCVIGDSMSLGWDKYVEADLRIVIDNYGQGGTTMPYIKQQAQTVVSRAPGKDVIIWGGHNDFSTSKGSTPDAVVPGIAWINDLVASKGGHLFVLGLSGSPVAPKGSDGYNKALEINSQLRTTYGPRFFGIRSWLIHHGLDAAGLEPTAQDLIDINELDIPPDSLRSDWGNPGHLDPATGKPAAGHRIGAWIKVARAL